LCDASRKAVSGHEKLNRLQKTVFIQTAKPVFKNGIRGQNETESDIMVFDVTRLRSVPCCVPKSRKKLIPVSSWSS